MSFSSKDLAVLVARFRSQPLSGRLVQLVPYAPEFAEPLRHLRNQEKNRTMLAQSAEITAAMQQAWYEGYLARDNDLCWAVLDRAGRFVGTTSLYDLSAEKRIGEKGRFVMDETAARGFPVALEAELLLIRFYFEHLPFDQLMTRVQPQNPKVISYNGRLGFKITGDSEIRGVPYVRLDLRRADFQPESFTPLLLHWSKRPL